MYQALIVLASPSAKPSLYVIPRKPQMNTLMYVYLCITNEELEGKLDYERVQDHRGRKTAFKPRFIRV